MGAREELWQMYQKESTPEVKRQILQSLFVSGDSAHLIEVANSEQNPELRRRAVQHLGTMGRTSTGEALVAIYAKEKDADIKRSVINALFTQNNADSLVAIARKETDAALKREIVAEAVAHDQVQGRHGLLDGDLEQMTGARLGVVGSAPALSWACLPPDRHQPPQRRRRGSPTAASRRTRRRTSRATCRPWPRRSASRCGSATRSR